MTVQELNDNYVFKVTKRALLREFPFIKDVYIKDPEDINKYSSIIFFDVVVDPYVLSHMLGVKVDKLADRWLRKGDEYYSPYLASFVERGDEIDEVKRAIKALLSGISNSTAIPPELKLKKELDIGSYIAYPHFVPPSLHDNMTKPN